MRQRNRRIVPLGVIADHRGGVLHGMRPLDVTASPGAVGDVAEDDVDRDAIGVGVVDRHRRVLQADRAVGHHHHRLALDLGVAVGHGHRRLLVAARQQLRRAVPAVVEDRLVKRPKGRARIGGNVVDVQRLDHVDHEVCAWAVGGVDVDARWRWTCFGGGQRRGRQRRRRPGGLRLGRADRTRGARDERCSAGRCTFQESPPAERTSFLRQHDLFVSIRNRPAR